MRPWNVLYRDHPELRNASVRALQIPVSCPICLSREAPE